MRSRWTFVSDFAPRTAFVIDIRARDNRKSTAIIARYTHGVSQSYRLSSTYKDAQDSNKKYLL